MSNALDATRDAPITTTIRDCLVQAWISPTDGESAGAAAWTIDIGGDEHVGPRVDRDQHASLDNVKDMLRKWAKDHPTLFD